jgi:hypothetical protein
MDMARTLSPRNEKLLHALICLATLLATAPPSTATAAEAKGTSTIVILSTPPAFIPLRSDRPLSKKERLDPKNYAFPKDAEEPIHGDINNDGKEEFLTFFHRKRYTSEDGLSDTSFALTIYSIQPKGLSLLWSDDTELNYGCCSDIAAGTDGLASVGDIDGSGENKLLVEPGVSDVSSPYDICIWSNNRLEKVLSALFDSYPYDGVSRLTSADGIPLLKGRLSNLSFLKYKGKPMIEAKFEGTIGTIPNEKHYSFEKDGGKVLFGRILNDVFVVEYIP